MRFAFFFLLLHFSTFISFVAHGQNSQAADSIEGIAHQAYLNGLHEIALEHLHQLNGIYNAQSDRSKYLENYISIAEVLRASENYGQSLAYLNHVRRQLSRSGDYLLRARIYNRMAAVYFEKRDFEKCLSYLDSSNRILDINATPKLRSSNLLIEGAVRTETSDFAGANAALIKALASFEKDKDVPNNISALFNLAKLHGRTEKWDSSIKCAERGLKLAAEHGINAQVGFGYLILSDAYIGKNDFVTGYQYYKKHKETDDVLKSESTRKSIEYLNSLFDQSEAANENRLLKIRENKNRQLLGFVVFVALLLVLFGIYLIYKGKKLKSLNRALEEQKVALLEKNNELDSLNKLLVDSSEKQEKLLKVNNKLFSIISHDLKSPLDNLAGFINIALNKELSKEKLQELLSGLSRRTQYTLYLLENLVNWSITQAGEFKLIMNELVLQEVLRVEIENCYALAEGKKIVLESKIPPTPILLRSDKDVIQFVFRNLCVNAVKFTKPQGRISVEVFRRGDSAGFSITDTGVGIPKENLENLESLSLVRGYGTANEKGTGLGLALCVKFVRDLGGTLNIESEEGAGTKVSCTFPLNLQNSSR